VSRWSTNGISPGRLSPIRRQKMYRTSPPLTAGEIREDISPEDLIRALVGMCYMNDQPGWQKSVLRLVDVFIDGLRNRRAAQGSRQRKSH
jgi:hypothetical protein